MPNEKAPGPPGCFKPEFAVQMVFFAKLADLDSAGAPMIEAARADRIAWAAYPKAGQLGTDLNRDVPWKALEKKGVQPV